MTMPATTRTPDGRHVAYAEWGDPDGAPVFLLHGTPGCRLNRPEELERLREAGVRLVTYDRAGYGASDRHRGRRVVDCVGDVRAIADAVGLDQFAVIGGSGGGPHALAVAARLADRVSRAHCVVGIAPYDAEGLDWTAGMDPQNIKELRWAVDGEERLTVELEREAAATQARVAMDPATVLAEFDLPEADLAILADPRVQTRIRAATAEMFANGVFGWVDDDLAFVSPWGFELSEIAIPVEVRYGASDVLVPAAHGEWLMAHVPGARAIVDTEGGHMIDPDKWIEELRRLAHGD